MRDVPCPRCRAALPVAPAVATRQNVVCPNCREAAEVELLPLALRPLEGGRAAAPGGPDESHCFFHPDKRAEASCEECGRFVCAVCEIRVGGRCLCPTCFSGGARGARRVETERFRLMPTQIAMWVAIATTVSWPLGIIGGPTAIGLAIWGLWKPRSLTGNRGVAPAVLAILLGLGLVIFWLGVISVIASGGD